jgi:hypothetical protein
VQQLSNLIPGFNMSPCYDDINAAVQLYANLVDTQSVPNELKRWQAKWREAQYEDQQLPKNALDSLENCSPCFYPNVRKLLLILATLPVTTASAERSFSTLRRLKTYLRSTMTENRLSSLALLNIHQDIVLSPEEVMDVFANGNRRMDF